ncbi:MAG TPA: ATP-binding protein [Bacteroidales bacterium]|nr:ATP-binding protein [Bacteroidales bacterium]
MILKEDLRRYLLKQQEQLYRDLGVSRDIHLKLIPNFVLLISGIRRCGKSTLARQFLNDKSPIYYANFEDINLSGFELKDFIKLEEILKTEFGENGYFFFDEIQNINGWEKYIRQLVDQKEKVVVTGSNASMLSSEMGTKLTGRHITKELFPFSYKEFLRLRKNNHSLDLFTEYLTEGGFPEYLKSGEKDILQFLFQDIISRDIIQRNELKNETAVKSLIQYIISNIGKEASFNKLKTYIGVSSTNSVSQYVHHLEQAYLIFSIKKFDYSIKKQLIHPKKMYCIDNAIIGTNAFSFSENKGRLLENLVFLELKRQGSEIFYHKNNFECDFVLKKGTRITEAIQVCYELNPDNQEREFNGLLSAIQDFHPDKAVLLTYDQEEKITYKTKKIQILPVWKWLLERHSH